LPQDPREERRNADEVAPGETPRLLRQPIAPFEPPPFHPRRRTRHVAGKEIEQGPDANAEAAPCRSQVLLDKQLLFGIAHRHKQNVSLRLANELNELRNLAVIEMTMVTTNKLMFRAY
jgi:hypothetical protein